MRTAEVFGDGDGSEVDVDSGWNTPSEPEAKLAAAKAKESSTPKPKPVRDPAAPVAVEITPETSIGAAFLARSQEPSRMPWVIAALLGVAVLSLIAYIVLR
jgi:predicted membrane-bound mannosyltransferase